MQVILKMLPKFKMATRAEIIQILQSLSPRYGDVRVFF